MIMSCCDPYALMYGLRYFVLRYREMLRMSFVCKHAMQTHRSTTKTLLQKRIPAHLNELYGGGKQATNQVKITNSEECTASQVCNLFGAAGDAILKHKKTKIRASSKPRPHNS